MLSVVFRKTVLTKETLKYTKTSLFLGKALKATLVCAQNALGNCRA